MWGIKDKVASTIQCKNSDIPRVGKTGATTTDLPSIKISSSIWIYSVRFTYIISFIFFDLCNLGSMQKFDVL